MRIPAFLSRATVPREASVREHAVYEAEDLKERCLGSIPRDYWSYSPFGGGYYSRPNGCQDGSYEIWRNCPQYEPDGAARLRTVEKDVQARPYSIPLFGVLGALGGGAVGAGIAAAVSALAGLAVPLAVGAAVGALAGGLALTRYAAGDRVRIEWREQPINEKKLVGYWDTVTPHWVQVCHTVTDSKNQSHQECHLEQHGWDHDFSPDVRYWSVGSFVGPEVVHFQASSGEWKPAPVKTDGDKPLSDPIPDNGAKSPAAAMPDSPPLEKQPAAA